jgi:hypothetical protein
MTHLSRSSHSPHSPRTARHTARHTRPERLSRLVLAAALALGTLAPSSSWAADTSADPHADPRTLEASKHFGAGVKLSDDGDWRAAVIEFERAYAIAPNFRVLFDIGQCRYQLHDYPGALAAFQRYKSEGGDAIPPDRRAQLDADIDLLKGRVATLRVVSATTDAQVTLDDANIGTTPLSSPVAVSAGRHKLVLRKAGKTDAERSFDIAGEETLDIRLDFGGPSTETEPAPSDRSIAPAVVGFSVAAAGIAVGSVFGFLAMSDKSKLDRACDGKSCPPSSQSTFDDGRRDGLVSTIGFAAAIAGAGAGAAYLLFATPGRPEGASTARSVPSFQVFVGPGAIATKGTF